MLTCKSLSFRCFETRVAIGSIQSPRCAVTTRAHSYLPHENSSPFDQHPRPFPTHPPLQQSGHYHSLLLWLRLSQIPHVRSHSLSLDLSPLSVMVSRASHAFPNYRIPSSSGTLLYIHMPHFKNPPSHRYLVYFYALTTINNALAVSTALNTYHRNVLPCI